MAGRLERLSADLVWEASGGNALFMRHLIDGALETGALRQVNGVWQLRGQTTVTSQLAELLSDRVDRLPDDEKRACNSWPSPNPWPWGSSPSWSPPTRSNARSAAA